MHGLINRSVQGYLRDTYGSRVWRAAAAIGAPPEGFEPMLRYDDALTESLLLAAERASGMTRAALLEDIGGYAAGADPVRRLLRFGGADYPEFLFSLDELRERGLMTLPDLELPDLRTTVVAAGGECYSVTVRGRAFGWGAVCAGTLRTMADDYGALALIEAFSDASGAEHVGVRILDPGHAAGREFSLAEAGSAEQGAGA